MSLKDKKLPFAQWEIILTSIPMLTRTQ